MNDIQIKLQNELFNEHYKLFRILVYGCGGVMFRQHFIKFMGGSESKCGEIIKLMEDFKLIKQQRVGKNFIVVAKYAMLCKFDLENKSVRLSSGRVFHSALLCEMLLHTYNPEEIDKIERLLSLSNFFYFTPRNSYRILSRIYNYLYERGFTSLDTLEWSMKQLDTKTTFIETSYKGRSESLPEQDIEVIDLLVLRSLDMYVKSITSDGDSIKLNMALFATNMNAEKIAKAIRKTETALSDMFGDIPIKYRFDIYSLSERIEGIEKRTMKNLLAAKGGELKEDFYSSIITYHWYNRKTALFSGIDIDKWL